MNRKRIFEGSASSGGRLSTLAKCRALGCRRVATLLALAALAAVPHPASGQSLSVAELAGQLVSDRAPVIIDVRSSSSYGAGHIPNAINIPFPSLGSRRLPPLGEVVVYDDGMGRGKIEEAVALLNEKQGINALALAGGYAAWETLSGVTTARRGLAPERKPVITYQDLVATRGEGIVVYDLRRAEADPPAGAEGGARLASTGAPPPQSADLLELLPLARQESGSPMKLLGSESRRAPSGGATLMASEDAETPLLRGKAMDTGALIVLIDDDHKTAEQTAQRLRAGGFERVAVLAGGDMILQFEGRPGLQRQGLGSATQSAEDAESAGENEEGGQ